MLGKVLSIYENYILFEITDASLLSKDIIEKYLVFEKNRALVGKIISLENNIAKIVMLGEIENNNFITGVALKPSLGENARFTNSEEMLKIINNYSTDQKTFYLGKAPVYMDEKIYVPTNKFFSNHFAIFGNSGSGKSYGVARIIQNLFSDQKRIPINSTIFIFDAFGEYEEAFNMLNSSIVFKRYTTELKKDKENTIRIPLWLLNVDDIALLLNATDAEQIPLIEKALRLVTVFSKKDQETTIYKNDILARAMLDTLYSGKAPGQIIDQLVATLTQYNTETLNLNTMIVQPGYTRPVKQCLIINNEGKIQDTRLIADFFSSYKRSNLKQEMSNGTKWFNLLDLQEALDYALISEGILQSDKVYDKMNILKVRLNTLINSEYSILFDVPNYISKVEYIKSLLLDENNLKAQIININLNYVDDRLAKTICKIYTKILFNFEMSLTKRGNFPIHILIEEAHRYVQNDGDIDLFGYNIFDRVAKEGRKYGLLLGLISQRPSELSETTISQCSNYLIFKMMHPKDIEYIKESLPNFSDDVLEKLNLLQPGTCVAFGSAFNFPIIIKLDEPNPHPRSANVDISSIWY